MRGAHKPPKKQSKKPFKNPAQRTAFYHLCHFLCLITQFCHSERQLLKNVIASLGAYSKMQLATITVSSKLLVIYLFLLM